MNENTASQGFATVLYAIQRSTIIYYYNRVSTFRHPAPPQQQQTEYIYYIRRVYILCIYSIQFIWSRFRDEIGSQKRLYRFGKRLEENVCRCRARVASGVLCLYNAHARKRRRTHAHIIREIYLSVLRDIIIYVHCASSVCV